MSNFRVHRDLLFQNVNEMHAFRDFLNGVLLTQNIQGGTKVSNIGCNFLI
jgi:hypothetical protein